MSTCWQFMHMWLEGPRPFTLPAHTKSTEAHVFKEHCAKAAPAQTTCYGNAGQGLTLMSVQASPQDSPEIQSKRKYSTESQAPSEEAGRNQDDPPHTEVQVRALMTEHMLQQSLSC